MFPGSRAFPSIVLVVLGIVAQAWPGVTIAADQLVVQGKERARLKGCGGGTEPVDFTLRLDDPSVWTLTLAAITPGQTTLGGSYIVGGRRDRRVTLETDTTGIAALAARAGAIVSQLCGASTGVDSLEIKTLKLIRGRKAATLKLTAQFVATTGKRGRLKVSGKGPLESVATTSSTIAASTSSTVAETSTSSTTVTTTTSTTTTTNECFGKADGTPCTNDTNICSQDLCRGEVCTHDTPYPNGGLNITCRQANGSACDVADNCLATVCPDRKRSSSEFCQPLVSTTYACNVVQAYVRCNGAQDECPPERHCAVGEACNGDDECVTGICVGRLCTADKSDIGGVCDTDVDCVFGPLYFGKCEGGICRGVLGNPCTFDDQCLTGYVCDIDGSGRCRVPIGGSCDLGFPFPSAQCAGGELPPWLDDKAVCDAVSGTCLSLTNQPCIYSSECVTGWCNCGDRTGLDLHCFPNGLCQVSPALPCTEDEECSDFLFGPSNTVLADGVCFEGRCDTYLRHGEVCEVNPPGARRCIPTESIACDTVDDCPAGEECDVPRHCFTPLPEHDDTGFDCDTIADCQAGESCETAFVPHLGDSPYDGLCGEEGEFCFKGAAGDCGAACGGPLDPADYVCCRNLQGSCSSDVDCCALFLAPSRGCGSAGTCRVLVGRSGPCTTSADCGRQSAEGGPLRCLNGICEPPAVVLPAGSPCDPEADPNVTHCDTGLTCFDCRPEGRGYRCADAVAPCCRPGGADFDFCGQKLMNGDSYDNLCCNFSCRPADDDQHCGSCENDCTADSGNACVTQPGQCVLDDLGVRCERQIDESICATVIPPPGQEIHCVSLGDDPPLAVCEPYIPSSNMVDWSPLVLCEESPVKAVCTTDAQCCSCSCVQTTNSSASGLFNFTSGAVRSCRCP